MPEQMTDASGDIQARHDEAVARRRQARAAHDLPAWIQAAYDCGTCLFELEQYGMALQLLKEATDLIAAHGLHRELLPEAFGLSGRATQRLQRWDEVLAWYQHAAQAAREQGLPTQDLRWQLKEATTLLDMGQAAQGRARLQAAVDTGRACQAAGHPVAEILAGGLERLACLEDTRHEDADACWNEAWALLDTLPPGPAHFHAAVHRAGFLTERGQHWAAQTYFEEALDIGRQIGIGDADLKQLVRQLAGTLRARNEPSQAGQWLMAHLPDELAHDLRHTFLTEAVDAFFAARDWLPMKEACELLIQARQDMRPGWRHDAQMRLSVALLKLRQHAAALAALDLAAQHAQAWGNPSSLVQVRGQRAIVLLDEGRHEEAATLSEALWAEGVHDPLNARTLVRAWIGAGQLDRAEALVQTCEAEGCDALTLAQLRAHLADAGRGDPQAAWYAVGVAARLDRRVEAEALTHLMAHTPAGSEKRFELARQRLRLLDVVRMQVDNVFSDASWHAAIDEADELPGWIDDFVDEAQRSERDEVAIYELERARAQTLVDLLAERRAMWSGLAQGGRTWLKGQATSRWQRARYRLQALIARGASWQDRRELAEHVERLRIDALSAAGLIHLAPAEQGVHFPEDLAHLLGEQVLQEGEAIVFAHRTPNGLALWMRTADGATRHTTLTGVTLELVRRGQQMLREVSGSQPGATLPAMASWLKELDTAIGQALMAWLSPTPVRRIFWSAGTELAALPLDCCASLLQADAPEWVQLPAGAALGFARQTRRPLPQHLFLVTPEDRERTAMHIMNAPRGRTLLLLDPTRDLQFAPLEAALVAHAHHGRQVQVMDTEQIDRQALARACGEAEIFHFCGHGSFGDANPYGSGIWIGPREQASSLWSNGDIFSDVEAPAGRLAVLSGCETGRTLPNLISEEVSLPAAFIAAGYAAVVASRWAVDDLSATLLMSDFHRRWLRGGISVAAALKASRQWLRELSRQEALDLTDTLGKTLEGALPGRDQDCRQISHGATALLQQEGDRPFADPMYWASFYVAGDGAIESKGTDCRIPASIAEARPVKAPPAA
ncbi:MAG: CHAT domain-containing protein [Aquabacterium sp.]